MPGDLPGEFLDRLRKLEESYLRETDPIRQSGFGGGPERWRRERGIILDAVDRDGDLLDTCCANGYLLECLVGWARSNGITLTPYGIDIGPRLVELARRRLPGFASHLQVANAWDWTPRRRFRYVYALLDCVPDDLGPEFVGRLLDRCTAPGGTLILGRYGSASRRFPAPDVAALLAGFGHRVAGSTSASHRGILVSSIAWLLRPRETAGQASPAPP